MVTTLSMNDRSISDMLATVFMVVIVFFVFSCITWMKSKILPSKGQGNNIAQPKKTSYFASHRFEPFNCCLGVVM